MTLTVVVGYFIGISVVRIGVGMGLQFLFQRVIQTRQIYKQTEVKPTTREQLFQWLGPLIDVLLAIGFVYLNLFNFIAQVYFFDFWMGVLILILSWICLVEPIYYGYHVLLHTPFLYRHHHRVHHEARIPNTSTAMTFTVLERITYPILFGLPLVIASYFGYLTIVLLFVYSIGIDLVNALGHSNRELFPKWYHRSSLKWLFYSATFHSQHHACVNKNYSLFMPIWDRLFHTVAESTDHVFDDVTSGKRCSL